MPNLFEQYELDPAKRQNGVPVEFAGSTFFCRFAGSGNRSYRFASAAEVSASPELAQKLDTGTEQEKMEAEDVLTMRAFFGNVVVGWEEVLDRSGSPLEFNRENYLDLMGSCPMVWEYVRMEARSLDNFRAQAKEEIVQETGKS
jgi:hypothetical protein